MLTSPSQYLRPEYLSPLPTTLDAKKSPLALLAQTCSNIGADNPNNKPIIPPLEKPKDSDKKEKSNNEEKSSFKPYESTKKEDKSSDVERKTPNCKSSVSPSTRTSSPNSTTGSCGKSSPGEVSKSESNNTNTTTSSSSPATSTSQSTLSALGYNTSALGLDLARADSALAKDGLSTMAHLGLSAYKNALSPLVNCTGCTPGHIPVDAASTGHTFPPGIATQSGISPLKPGFSPLTPYVGFARVKTASGGTTLVPICRDPYCTNCSLSLQSAQLASCPGGCTQCTHDRLGNSFGSSPGLPSFVPSLSGSTSPAGTTGLSYPPSLLSRPNVCSWMVGDTFCGKRFTTSEELLQHLRTHTSPLAGDSSSLNLFSPNISVPGTATSLSSAACHLYYSSAPSASLRRTYPTSLSPVSTLSANRYHPYKAPIPTTPLPPIPHPGLGMYYPYGLYGQRLGPPVHP